MSSYKFHIFVSKFTFCLYNFVIHTKNISTHIHIIDMLQSINHKSKHNMGQFFTTHQDLKDKIYEFILNSPETILEPSVGRGDLVESIISRTPSIKFDMYEIDPTIEPLQSIDKKSIIYNDFMIQQTTNIKSYTTIVGNPPFVRTKKGNLYIDFTEKCFNLLKENGELIFIVPSDFFKLTCASNILNQMMLSGTFTHIFHPHNERMFDDANIDVLVYRYCKNPRLGKNVFYNDIPLHVINNNGMITFHNEQITNTHRLGDIFNICVGIVTGKENVFKHKSLGNIDMINGNGTTERYIFVDEYPCINKETNKHLELHKQELIQRKIRKFNEKNWFEWGAPRNIKTILKHIGEECIYISNMTRKPQLAFRGNVGYFGGGLIMMIPLKKYNLDNVVSYLNSDTFKKHFTYSGRFKIGHRQISNTHIPETYLFTPLKI